MFAKEIIKNAFQRALLGDTELPTAKQEELAFFNLKLILESLVTDEFLLWNQERVTLTPASFVDNKATITAAANGPIPRKILNLYRLSADGQEKTPIELEGRLNFMEWTRDDPQSTPNRAYYQKRLDSLDLYLWPGSSDYNIVCDVVYGINPLIDINSSVDVPSYWIEPIILDLVDSLAPTYGLSDEELAKIIMRREKKEKEAKEFDSENASMYLVAGDKDGY